MSEPSMIPNRSSPKPYPLLAAVLWISGLTEMVFSRLVTGFIIVPSSIFWGYTVQIWSRALCKASYT